MNEYSQLFDSKLPADVKAKFEEIDSDPDAKLSRSEFIDWHMKKFGKLEDLQFQIVVGRLLNKAVDTTIIDEQPAVISGQD